VLASLYFRFLAVFFTRRGTTSQIAESISFFVILLLCFVVLFAAGVYTFRYARMPGRLDYLDRIVGTLLGLLLAALVSVVLAMVLNYAFVRNDPAASASMPLTRGFQASVRSSALSPLLLEFVLPRLYRSVAPFLPDAAQPFFRPS
jgi:membrane protein required for colicin V production